MRGWVNMSKWGGKTKSEFYLIRKFGNAGEGTSKGELSREPKGLTDSRTQNRGHLFKRAANRRD